jgi:hypothetical protein
MRRGRRFRVTGQSERAIRAADDQPVIDQGSERTRSLP